MLSGVCLGARWQVNDAPLLTSLATALLLLVQTDASCMIGSGCMSRSPKATSSSMMLLKLVRPFAPSSPRHASELVRTPYRSCYICITSGTGARGYVIQARGG